MVIPGWMCYVLMHMDLLGYMVKMGCLEASRHRLPIQLIQRMHEQVWSVEVSGAAPSAVRSDAILKGF